MKRNAYTIDHLNATVTVTKSFLKEAGVIGSPAYTEMLRLRRELPEYEISVNETKKRQSEEAYGKLTYKKMGAYIEAKEGEKSPVLAEFEKVQALAKVQKNPFLYVKTWFLNRYADDFAATETENNIVTINA